MIELSEDKQTEITSFLSGRFSTLEKLRDPLDNAIKEEIDLYNNIDKYNDVKAAHQKRYKINYLYTVVQTMTARLMESIFGNDNYVKAYFEDKDKIKYEKPYTRFVQDLCDQMQLRYKARDFIEEALVQRTCWLQLRPIRDDVKGTWYCDFNILKWFDVWFDTMAKSISETDFFVKKVAKLKDVKFNDKVYFNLDKIEGTQPPDYIKEKQEYKAKHGMTYYDPDKNNVTDSLELLEWYGEYDMGKDKEKPDFKEMIFTLANRSLLIRADEVKLQTKQKRFFFPIRPLRQANSLIGKGLPQIAKDPQYQLNEVVSRMMDNIALLTGLMFQFKKGGSVNFNELYAASGNAVGMDNMDDVRLFQIPNVIRECAAIQQEIIQEIQQLTGAVDYVMGTSAGRGITETATGISKIVDQAMFKFSMMTENVVWDILSFINFAVILRVKYDRDNVLLEYPELEGLLGGSELLLEETKYFDLAIKDLSQRREVERTQFINAVNIIAPLLQGVQGNVKELLREILDKIGVENVDKMLEPDVQLQQQQMMQAMMQQAGAAQQQKASQNTPTTNMTPEEAAGQVNAVRSQSRGI